MKTVFFLCLITGMLTACSGTPEEQDSSRNAKQETANEENERDTIADTSADTIVKDHPSKKDTVASTQPKGIPLNEAKVLYRQICMACHGMEGEGIVGSNLTDDFWISSGTREAIVASIRYGTPKKGMPGFAAQCTMKELYGLADYILQLPPKSGKEPEGKKVR